MCRKCGAELLAAPQVGPPPGLDDLGAAWAYEGRARDLVAGLKYGRCPGARRQVAIAMAEATPPGAAVVTWAPTSAARRRHRGFDPAEVLARPLARRLGLPVRPLLRRVGGGTQTGRDLASRLADPPRFVVRRAVGGTVLVVDDVCTSGATLGSAATALRDAGAASVLAVVAARRP